ncbi:MAG TPA: HAD-IA family hydrolase [Terriglobales bacterium]|nr:HAD-IA family hydrolase [Terriglobales bacterium]
MKPVLAFDMDGVLVDVTQSFRLAIVATVAGLGGGVATPDEVQALKNAGGFNNDWDLSRELLRRRGRDFTRPEVIAAFDAHYLGGLRDQERWLLPPATIAALRERYTLCIFTGRPRRDSDYVLRRFNVADAFNIVLALEDVAVGKPAPDGLLELRRCCAPQPLVAYIGDTVDDATSAAAAGISFIGILAAAQARQAESAALFGARALATFADVDAACRWLLAQPMAHEAGL